MIAAVEMGIFASTAATLVVKTRIEQGFAVEAKIPRAISTRHVDKAQYSTQK